MKRLTIPFFVLLGAAGLSTAHLNSISDSVIELRNNEIQMKLRFTLICTLELFQIDLNGDLILSEEEIQPVKPMMYYYLSNKIKVLADGRQLKMEMRNVTFKVEEDDSYVTFDLRFPFQKKPDAFLVLCNVLEETDPYHRNLAEIKMNGNEYLFVFTNTNYFNSAEARPQPAGEIAPATPEPSANG
ncbi:MAG TPA: hypothetical protein PLH79_00535 [bacterium]|mgnify:CR=1 FL=1|nr:hypothetical protein [bacterium]HPP00372.1 hypothetical protein [bacterium]